MVCVAALNVGNRCHDVAAFGGSLTDIQYADVMHEKCWCQL